MPLPERANAQRAGLRLTVNANVVHANDSIRFPWVTVYITRQTVTRTFSYGLNLP